jgi:hypothetical protein
MRMMARARAGQPDFLDHLRAWTAAHPMAARTLLATPAILWMTDQFWPGPYEMEHWRETLGPYARALIPSLVAGWGIFAMTNKGMRELLAPTVSASTATEMRGPRPPPVGE